MNETWDLFVSVWFAIGYECLEAEVNGLVDYDAWICSKPEPSDEPEESVTERIARERAEYEDHCERVFEERRDDELIGEIK